VLKYIRKLHKIRNKIYMSDLARLRDNAANRLKQLQESSRKETNKNQSSEDNRFWRIERGKDGNASAIIRFLPTPFVDFEDDKALPWVKVYSHGFKDEKTGRWYIENSLTTINLPDPVAKLNRALWNTGEENNKTIVRRQKRKLQYFANVYVVKDPQNPENEGKVFLFKFGPKIFEKISNVMDPPESFMEEPTDPFSFSEGRNFKLRIQTVDGYPNYNESTFDSVAPIANKNGERLSDSDIENNVWKKEHSLLAFLKPENFKSYEELEKRLNYVLGQDDPDAPVKTKEQEATPKQKKPAAFEESNSDPEFKEPDIEINEQDLDALIADL
jgi:hypothetical protein